MSDSDRKVIQNLYSQNFGRYLTFHTLMSVGKKCFRYVRNVAASCAVLNFDVRYMIGGNYKMA